MFQPSYLKLQKTGELSKRIDKAYKILKECQLCPRRCRINRLAGEKGFCKVGKLPMVSSYNAHFGEEDPLVGQYGSGTIFFTYCNLGCLFCQNYEISHLGEGREVTTEELARMMLGLQEEGCHNINFVTPTHLIPQILAALPLAIKGGLNIPLVYNTGGYDLVETLTLLDGVFDIYMPDFKFAEEEIAVKLTGVKDYFEAAKTAIKEMHRQVGDLVLDKRGIAQKGLLIRHLVMPNGMAGTKKVMKFLAQEISKDTYVNIMNQYRPCGQAYNYPPLDRSISQAEYEEAIKIAREEGIHRFDQRDKMKIIRWL